MRFGLETFSEAEVINHPDRRKEKGRFDPLASSAHSWVGEVVSLDLRDGLWLCVAMVKIQSPLTPFAHGEVGKKLLFQTPYLGLISVETRDRLLHSAGGVERAGLGYTELRQAWNRLDICGRKACWNSLRTRGGRLKAGRHTGTGLCYCTRCTRKLNDAQGADTVVWIDEGLN